MGFVDIFRRCCWKRSGKTTDADVRRIYIGDVPLITDDGINGITKAMNATQSISHVPSTMVAESSATVEVADDQISQRPPSVKGVAVRRASDPAPKVRPMAMNQHFPDNVITSTRYTFWNFFFKNLYQQFRRPVNFYFLSVGILQCVIDSPVSPVTALAPLIFVMSVTMIKQGYEDYLRHKADATVNNRIVQVVRENELIGIMSKDIKVGDVVRLELDEQVPTDLLLLASSDDFHRCQINTANLDGETNLKVRYCPSGLYRFRHQTDFRNLHVIVECEQPNAELYEFNGNLLIPSDKMHQDRSGSICRAESLVAENAAAANLDRRASLRRLETYTEESGNVTPTSDFLQIPLSMDNVVLRGTRLKNTDYIYGLVIYTGGDTRLAQNSKNSAPKSSTVDKAVNSHFLFLILALVLLVCAATAFHYSIQWISDDAWYIPPNSKEKEMTESEKWKSRFNTFVSFLILFNYIIPISLCVTMEMMKFIGSKFFVWDAEMASDSGSPPLCNTSDLNEELGQIQYLFSDKTGTLTENIMKFRNCAINNKKYVYENDKLHLRNDEENTNTEVKIANNDDVRKFLTVLALCHTVQLMPIRRPSFESNGPSSRGLLAKKKKKVSSKLKNASSLFSIETTKPTRRLTVGAGGKWEYQASSPDEKALLESCHKLEVIYYGEKDNVLSVEVCGKMEYFKRHYVLEFDADRKCMSVIVENSNGEIFLLTKGAETTIIPNSDDGPASNVGKHVLDFALMGLRTLVVAQKRMTRDELHNFSTRLKQTRRLIKNREEKMRELYRWAESNLTILGATGVEDQLQSGVPETLQALGAAGIRVWMLTGDKLETAVNVAVACGLITASSKQIIVTKHSDGDEVKRRLTEILAEMEDGDNTTFVIDGESLATAYNSCPDLLCDATMLAFRVVCCRMAPLQKAQVVNMVKRTPSNPITAAVGDGANDVAMIQEAHIGIGILGKEGRQAARCSDFALAKFCFLKKAILVHGHWYYIRLSNLANYFFYKNFLFITPQVCFCFHSAFSTQALFDGNFLMLYNILYTACPVFFYGLLEQNYRAEILLSKPHLYKKLTCNSLMTWGQFLHWLLSAFWHGLVSYFITYFSWTFFQPITDLTCFGTVVFCNIVAVANFKMAVEAKFVTWIYVCAQCYSYTTMFLVTSVYSELDLTFMGINPGSFRHVYYTVLSCIPFYVTLLCILCTAILPDVLARALRNNWRKISTTLKKVPKRFFGRKPKLKSEID